MVASMIVARTTCGMSYIFIYISVYISGFWYLVGLIVELGFDKLHFVSYLLLIFFDNSLFITNK